MPTGRQLDWNLLSVAFEQNNLIEECIKKMLSSFSSFFPAIFLFLQIIESDWINERVNYESRLDLNKLGRELANKKKKIENEVFLSC